MCAQCFPQNIRRFPSWQDFAAFEDGLQRHLNGPHVTGVPVGPAAAGLPHPPERCYACAACGEIWALSTPDNAWRGYFLPLALVGVPEPPEAETRSSGCAGFDWFLLLSAEPLAFS